MTHSKSQPRFERGKRLAPPGAHGHVAQAVQSMMARLMGIARFLAVCVALGWLYGAVGPRLYPERDHFGFGYGMLHGAFMPMALPALLMGSDVNIFSPTKQGRGYKLGYIAGINVCGLLFFGSIFWRPSARRKGAPDAVTGAGGAQ